MKKILLSVAFLGAIFTSDAQTLLRDDFNSYTVGNIASAVPGTGQGGWIVFGNPAATAVTDFTIKSILTGNNAIEFKGSPLVTGVSPNPSTTRYIYKDITTLWNGRTSGNDVVKMEFSFNTGVATASENLFRAYLVTATGKTVAGVEYNVKTKTMIGIYSFTDGTPAVTNLYGQNMGPVVDPNANPVVFTPLVLQDNNWYRVLFLYDKTTGDLTFYCQGITDNTVDSGAITYGDAADNVSEVDFVIRSGSATNAASQVVMLDDLLINAQADTDLSIKENAVSSKFSVYPNPANNVINITNADNMLVNGVTVTDLNGRTVKNVSFEGVASAQVNVSDLASGMYILNVTSDKGTATKKFVKN
jgi:hypothetical protein